MMVLKEHDTLWRRSFALLFDGLIFLLFDFFESFITVPEMPVPIILIGITLYFLCAHFYSIYLHVIYGQTLGKMLMKVKVLDIKGTPISIKQAFFRDLPFIVFSFALLISDIYEVVHFGITEDFRSTNFNYLALSIATIWILAEVFVATRNEKRRSIHDFIAGTVVVSLSEKTS